MIKNIIKKEELLKIKSIDADNNDKYIIDELVDTLRFNSGHCVGMAANMIGYQKNIIVFYDNNKINVMVNPKIIFKSGEYKAMEGCLSLEGLRPTIRYKNIKVSYLDENFNKKTKQFKDFTAQIIEHEIDHLFGIII